MSKVYCRKWLILSVMMIAVGCGHHPAERSPSPESARVMASEKETEIQSALAQLPAEDRKLAEEQKFCAVRGNRLGSMGPPLKILVQGQTVFLCCEGCRDEALAQPDKTLARAKELRARSRP